MFQFISTFFPSISLQKCCLLCLYIFVNLTCLRFEKNLNDIEFQVHNPERGCYINSSFSLEEESDDVISSVSTPVSRKKVHFYGPYFRHKKVSIALVLGEIYGCGCVLRVFFLFYNGIFVSVKVLVILILILQRFLFHQLIVSFEQKFQNYWKP